MTVDEATKPVATEPSAEVKAWQDAKVCAAIDAADAGKFATAEQLRAIIRKYVRHG